MLGILWTVYASFELIGAGVLFLIANTLFSGFGHLPAPPEGPPPGVLHFLHVLFSFISVFLLAKAALGLFAGIGLLQRRHWARLIALVAGCISLINLPFGTALGIYTIWVMLSAKAETEYAKLAVVEE